MTITADDVIRAAASIARDTAEGRLRLGALEHQAVTECRELFGTVSGPDDPIWPLHVDIARQVLALDGVPPHELAKAGRGGSGLVAAEQARPTRYVTEVESPASGPHWADFRDAAPEPVARLSRSMRPR
jgi:hypothetical protein